VTAIAMQGKIPLECKGKTLPTFPDNPDLYDYMTGIQVPDSFIADIFGVSANERQTRIANTPMHLN
jgi:hypothetical protein